MFGLGRADTGECPRCHYLGWGFSDDLDGSTRRQIMNGALAVPPAERPRYGEIGRPEPTALPLITSQALTVTSVPICTYGKIFSAVGTGTSTQPRLCGQP